MQCKFYDKQITLPTIDGEFSLLAVKITIVQNWNITWVMWL